MNLSRRDLLAAGASLGAAGVLASLDRGTAAAQGALKLQLFTSDAGGFLVNSVILAGEKEAIAVDAQFSFANAHRLVAELLATGKRLSKVYITHPHPDHYFGQEVIKTAFPGVEIVAIPPVVAAIEEAFPKKIAQWGPRLGANGPSKACCRRRSPAMRSSSKATRSRSSARCRATPSTTRCSGFRASRR